MDPICMEVTLSISSSVEVSSSSAGHIGLSMVSGVISYSRVDPLASSGVCSLVGEPIPPQPEGWILGDCFGFSGERPWKLMDLNSRLSKHWMLNSDWRLISLGRGYYQILLKSPAEKNLVSSSSVIDPSISSVSSAVGVEHDSMTVVQGSSAVNQIRSLGPLSKSQVELCLIADSLWASRVKEVVRRSLWQSFRDMVSLVSSSWLVVRDFNMVMGAPEALGYRSLARDSCEDFRSMIEDCDLVDDVIPSLVTAIETAFLTSIPSVYAMDAAFTPGTDEFSSRFYQRCSDVISSDVVLTCIIDEDGGFLSDSTDFFPKGFLAPTHLLYTDDVLIFCRGTQKNLKNIIGAFEDYGDISSQLVNWSKSFIYFRSSVSPCRIGSLRSLVGMQIRQLPFSYLGVPFASGWLSSLLSLINRKLRNFLRTGTCEETKLVRVTWDCCCRPYSQVGFGLKDLG
ncbi:hypothetical protein Dsin_024578 [Dipteronia sinensis]|uniref:Reverse transcriptase domain-containing protein n=1 Tax=Dipteronia sinensis TaxID=43782 RepID=A0AAD9ZVM7_9ROSI|nr:hypothetical protein Dsin_024578 [Dipteronia sinensis]